MRMEHIYQNSPRFRNWLVACRCATILAVIVGLVVAIGCSTKQESVQGDSQVFYSESGNVSVLVKPFSNLSPGETVSFKVSGTAPHQVYIKTVEVKPRKLYQWSPSILYRKDYKWPNRIVAQEGGRDSVTVSTDIPTTVDGTHILDLSVLYTFAEYNNASGCSDLK